MVATEHAHKIEQGRVLLLKQKYREGKKNKSDKDVKCGHRH